MFSWRNKKCINTFKFKKSALSVAMVFFLQIMYTWTYPGTGHKPFLILTKTNIFHPGSMTLKSTMQVKNDEHTKTQNKL